MAKKIRIESDGTYNGTKVFVDDKQVNNLTSVKFEAVDRKPLIKLLLGYAYPEEALADLKVEEKI
jgi:hypothetical protein